MFDVEKDEFDDVKKIVENKMKRAMKLNVPIEVDIGFGNTWFEAHT